MRLPSKIKNLLESELIRITSLQTQLRLTCNLKSVKRLAAGLIKSKNFRDVSNQYDNRKKKNSKVDSAEFLST